MARSPLRTKLNIHMKHAILLTTHCWNSQRRAGFHWIADALWRRGWTVLFITDALCWIDRIRGDYRFQHIPPGGVNCICEEEERFCSYIIWHPWRPASVRPRIINRLTYSWFSRFGSIQLPGLEPHIRRADLFVFESSFGLMFFERFKVLNAHARFVYRVSDDLYLFNTHPVVCDAETRVAPHFDLVSTVTPSIHRRFQHLPNAALAHHGIPCHLYDACERSPYTQPGVPHAVFVGTGFVDVDFFVRATRLRPDIHFHVIGPIRNLPRTPNLTAYGEMPYALTIPYVKFADVALNPRTVGGLMDGNKAMQYTYCRLPIITSLVNRDSRPHVFCYEPHNDSSIGESFRLALAFDRFLVPSHIVRSWDHLTDVLVGPHTDAH